MSKEDWTVHVGDDYVRVLERADAHTEEMVAEVYGDGNIEQEGRAHVIAASLELQKALLDTQSAMEEYGDLCNWPEGLWAQVFAQGNNALHKSYGNGGSLDHDRPDAKVHRCWRKQISS